MRLEAVNPANGEALAHFEEMTPQQVADTIVQADAAFKVWRCASSAARSTSMREAARVLRSGATDYARLMAQEMGKPVRDGLGELEKCALGCDYYAANAEHFLTAERIKIEARKSYITFQPLGVILAIMPWNFPFWQVFRFAAPALMAGNAAVLKHASNVPGCAIAIENIFRKAGFPENLFRTLLIGSAGVPAVLEHPLVRAATLTGSGAAGRAVAAKAGSLLKKTVLELGGSDP